MEQNINFELNRFLDFIDKKMDTSNRCSFETQYPLTVCVGSIIAILALGERCVLSFLQDKKYNQRVIFLFLQIWIRRRRKIQETVKYQQSIQWGVQCGGDIFIEYDATITFCAIFESLQIWRYHENNGWCKWDR